MSAHVLMNLFNELGKRDKMQGLPQRVCRSMNVRFCLSYYAKTNFKPRENAEILTYCTRRYYGHYYITLLKYVKPLVVDFMMHGVIPLPDATSYMIKYIKAPIPQYSFGCGMF